MPIPGHTVSRARTTGGCDVWVDKDSLEGNLEKMHIKAHAKDADLDLVLVPKKPIVLNGEKGYSRKSEESPLIASLYFSSTDLDDNRDREAG